MSYHRTYAYCNVVALIGIAIASSAGMYLLWHGISVPSTFKLQVAVAGGVGLLLFALSVYIKRRTSNRQYYETLRYWQER